MLSIDEVIARERQMAETHRNDIVPKENYHNMPWIDKNNETSMRNAEEHEQIANWLEELKVIKEMDLSIPQHFTKEQSDWIKKYCINRNREFYNKALDDFAILMKEAINQDWTTTYSYGPITYNRLFDKCNEIAEQLREGIKE